nr:glycosyltransferase family 2 protein [Thermoleophilaceae bacterium]
MTRLPSPDPRLRCCVVVPAHDEEDLVGACMTALVNQRGLRPGEHEVLLVLDHCTDRTADRARTAAACSDTPLHLLQSGERGVGATRRAGMNAARDRLLSLRRPGALIACTDADSVPAPD